MIRTITIHEVECDTCLRALPLTSLVRMVVTMEAHGWAVIEGKHVCKECMKKREADGKNKLA